MLRGSTQGTGDETRRLKKPGNPHDPHDRVEGARVEEVETAVSEAYRGIKEGPGEVVDEENQPGIPDEPHSEPQVESGVPTGVEVEPGGETDVERDRSAGHEDVDATTDGRAEEAHSNVHVKVESAETRQDEPIVGERWSMSAHARSTTY